MTNIIVCGATGRMGKMIIDVIKKNKQTALVGALEHKGHALLGQDIGVLSGLGPLNIPLSSNINENISAADVVIDFSHAPATIEYLNAAAGANKAMVIGTTGFTVGQRHEIYDLANKIPCVLSPNMSIGVNVMYKALRVMAELLGNDYDVEVIEAHHRQKKDAPSGTALKIAEVLAESLHRNLEQVGVYSRKGFIGERTKEEIGIQTIRAGDIVGEHTVIFGGVGERLEITHRAQSRENFARGAVKAAEWVINQKPGLYDMQDVLGLK